MLALDTAVLAYDANQWMNNTDVSPPSNEHRFDKGFDTTFLDACIDPARVCSQATRVPASIGIEQAILESRWGRSRLSAEAHNDCEIRSNRLAGSVSMSRRFMPRTRMMPSRRSL
jgi:flagellum-specific peptidoglycan hydrolase FlgJ